MNYTLLSLISFAHGGIAHMLVEKSNHAALIFYFLEKAI